MATNASVACRRIWHGQQSIPPKTEKGHGRHYSPAEYYGFWISTTSDGDEIYPFVSWDDAKKFVEAIDAVHPQKGTYQSFIDAVWVCLYVFGDEHQQSGAHFVLTNDDDLTEEQVEALFAAGEAARGE